jgi:hypothetical protein
MNLARLLMLYLILNYMCVHRQRLVGTRLFGLHIHRGDKGTSAHGSHGKVRKVSGTAPLHPTHLNTRCSGNSAPSEESWRMATSP